jgi:hypothetical protein
MVADSRAKLLPWQAPFAVDAALNGVDCHVRTQTLRRESTMDSAFGIWLWLSAVSGLSSLFFILLPALTFALDWDNFLEDLATYWPRTIFRIWRSATLVSASILSLLNIPYWLSKQPMGWIDLPAINLIAHDQFGALLLSGSIAGSTFSILGLAVLLKREYVI